MLLLRNHRREVHFTPAAPYGRYIDWCARAANAEE